MHCRLFSFLFLSMATSCAVAEPATVPIYTEGRGARPQAAVLKKAKELKEAGALLAMDRVAEQSKRTTCAMALPPVEKQKREGRDLWQRARKAHLRVGWLYLCKDCDRWHLNLSGGYAITNECAATCAHVLEPLDMREGFFIAADDEDNVFPVTEVLASSRALDTAIVRLKTDTLAPLPLGTDVAPGDTVFCFSDPMDRRGFFSQGIVNRLVKRPFLRKREVKDMDKEAAAALPTPVWLEVSTDWAPGSSGSAVLDASGNAVGHVSEIEPVLEDPLPNAKRQQAKLRGTVIIFHDAIAASNVLTLVKPVIRQQSSVNSVRQ